MPVPHAAATPPARGSVLLVPGIDDTGARFASLEPDLRAAGFGTVCATLHPVDGRAGLDDLAGQLRDFVGRSFEPDRRFAVVAFSMGGLIARHYLQHLGGAARATLLYTLSCPHHGTLCAYLRPGRGVRQMRPGSAFLRALERTQDRLGRMPLFSTWTPFDLTVVPARSSRWPIAANRVFPVLLHPWVTSAPAVRRHVVAALLNAAAG